MSGLDVVLLVIIGFSAIGGLRRGFLLGTVDLFAFLFALLVGAKLADMVALPLRDRGLPNPLAGAAGFFLAAVIAYAVIGVAIRILVAPLGSLASPTLAWLNSVLGLIPGAIRGTALAALVVLALTALPAELGMRLHLYQSHMAAPLASAGTQFYDASLAFAGVDPYELGFPREGFPRALSP